MDGQINPQQAGNHAPRHRVSTSTRWHFAFSVMLS